MKGKKSLVMCISTLCAPKSTEMMVKSICTYMITNQIIILTPSNSHVTLTHWNSLNLIKQWTAGFSSSSCPFYVGELCGFWILWTAAAFSSIVVIAGVLRACNAASDGCWAVLKKIQWSTLNTSYTSHLRSTFTNPLVRDNAPPLSEHISERN